MQTAFSITNVTFSADPVAPGTVELSVNFQIHNNGPSHVAGLVVTTDFWVTSQVASARFQGFGAGFEFWRADFSSRSMRGSFTCTSPPLVLADEFGVARFVTVDLRPRYNIAPSHTVEAIIRDAVEKRMGPMRWGLTLTSATDSAPAPINARAETVATLPLLRDAFRRRRCLIVADGFDEWRKDGRAKTFAYLRDVIERVSTHPARMVLELTPREWKRLTPRTRCRCPVRTDTSHARLLSGGCRVLVPLGAAHGRHE